jgi:coenzyme F420 hydrogenase subunit beta
VVYAGNWHALRFQIFAITNHLIGRQELCNQVYRQNYGNTVSVSMCRDVVANGLCCGCGVCAAICPSSCLDMEFSRYGEYNPIQQPGCTNCNLCSKVCPFANGNPTEDLMATRLFGDVKGVGKRMECGYYLSSFVGYSKTHRNNGASGGLATWTLETLLRQGEIGRVICASSNPNPEKLFKFIVTDNIEDLRKCSKSSYYPLELSEVLKFVFNNEGRYAVIGLPCFIKALRLAEGCNTKVRERIVFHAGIVCGMLMSSFYAEYVAKLTDQDPGIVKKITFREKKPDLPATHHLVKIWGEPECSRPLAEVEHLRGPHIAWENWFFKLNTCNYCDDVFAELADVVFMDAWLPEYSSRSGGDSLVIARTVLASDMIRSGISTGELSVSEIPIERVILSQRPVLKDKRENLAVRLRILESRGVKVPFKRVAPATNSSKQVITSQRDMLAMQAESRDAWLATGKRGVSAFLKRISAYKARLRKKKYLFIRHKVQNGIKKAIKRIVGN